MTEMGVVRQVGEQHVLGDHHAPSQGGGAPQCPTFWDPLLTPICIYFIFLLFLTSFQYLSLCSFLLFFLYVFLLYPVFDFIINK